MYCPECGGEYREGFTHCADCDVDLVEDIPRAQTAPPCLEGALVTVLETGNPSELIFAESVLQQAGIPFVKRGGRVGPRRGDGVNGEAESEAPLCPRCGADGSPPVLDRLQDRLAKLAALSKRRA